MQHSKCQPKALAAHVVRLFVLRINQMNANSLSLSEIRAQQHQEKEEDDDDEATTVAADPVTIPTKLSNICESSERIGNSCRTIIALASFEIFEIYTHNTFKKNLFVCI